ncbi:hypothetical protein PIB30_095806 [Stylosanthes scabra]|uniref:Secreted protein n=1 Tax=Stylosanthes scabra TaxID=79078 RepID=A0ABU6WYK5_9FABA|nr:hypothetical protein [Stylosanthes scabra]
MAKTLFVHVFSVSAYSHLTPLSFHLITIEELHFTFDVASYRRLSHCSRSAQESSVAVSLKLSTVIPCLSPSSCAGRLLPLASIDLTGHKFGRSGNKPPPVAITDLAVTAVTRRNAASLCFQSSAPI